MMIVVLVVAVLMAIAIPTFFGAKSRADDAAARSTLTAAAKTTTIVGGDTTLDLMTRAALQTMEPGLTWNAEDAPSNGPNEVAWSTNPDPAPTNLVLIVRSASGKAFYRVTSSVALAGTTGATTSFTFTGSFQTGAGVTATPANALLAARGIALTPTTTTTAVPSTTSTVDPKTTTTTADPKATTTTVDPKATTTTVDPKATTTLNPKEAEQKDAEQKDADEKEGASEVPVCDGKAVYDAKSGTCR